MRKVAHCIAFVSAALLISQAVAAAEYSGVMTVNDDDYGYWEGKLKAFLDGKQTALEALAGPIAEPIAFEVSHDLVQGLFRQFVPRPTDPTLN